MLNISAISRKTGDVLSQRVALGLGISTSVLASFLKTIRRIEKENPKAIELLSVIGILDGTCMKEVFLERCYKRMREYNKVKQILINYSIVKRNERITEFSDERVSYLTIHSLYQEAIKIYIIQNNSKGKAIEKFVEMIGKKATEDFSMNFLNEGLLWYIHLELIWKQSCHRNTLVETLSNDFSLVHFLAFVGFTHDLNRNIMNDIYELKKKKNDISDPIFYCVRLALLVKVVFNNMIVPNELEDSFSKLELEILFNVNSSPVKNILLDQLYKYRELCLPTETGYINQDFGYSYLFNYGYWGKVLNHKFVRNKKYPITTYVSCICHKEMKRYDKALELLYTIPEFNNIHNVVNAKVQIGCCMILKGKVKEGLEIIESVESISDNSVRDVGRALFDVGMFEESEKYFAKWKPICCRYFEIDALCKMIMLECKTISFPYGILHTKFPHLTMSCKLVRLQLLFYCHLIDHDQVEKANEHLNKVVVPEIDHQEYTGNLFRETQMLAEHWEKTKEFGKALILYRVIKSFENKIYNHEHIIEDIDADIFKNAETKINAILLAIAF